MQEDINDEFDEAQTIGEILRNARNKQGKNLREIADELCIRSSYLDAIENMDIKNIPEAPYGIGFIRSYAEYLGLNGERIITSYKQTVYGLSEQTTNPQEYKNSQTTPKWRHILWGILGLAVLAYVWLQRPFWETRDTVVEFENTLDNSAITEPIIIDKIDSLPQSVEEKQEQTSPQEQDNNLNEKVLPQEQDSNLKEQVLPQKQDNDSNSIIKDATETDKNKKEQNTTDTQNTVKEEAEKDTKTEVNKTEATATPQVVKMILTGPSWVELKVKGKIVLSRTLRKGFEYVIDDVANTTVTAGRHNNVKFFVNDKEVKVVTAVQRKNVALIKFIKTDNKAE